MGQDTEYPERVNFTIYWVKKKKNSFKRVSETLKSSIVLGLYVKDLTNNHICIRTSTWQCKRKNAGIK